LEEFDLDRAPMLKRDTIAAAVKASTACSKRLRS
jgi:hypothetical protein